MPPMIQLVLISFPRSPGPTCLPQLRRRQGAKGQEYDRVYIDPDIAASLSRPEALLTNAFGDEANIAYVGFTRAIRELHLPRDFKTILTPEWQEVIERYELVQVAKTPKFLHVNRKRASRPGLPGTRYGEFTIEADLPKPPRKKPFKVGDRVRTGHGTGTVVETDGDKYLVALDGQAAHLWEKEWGLKRA